MLLQKGAGQTLFGMLFASCACRSTEDKDMVAMMQAVQRYSLPLLAIGIATGLLALIPKVGWLLGFSAFALAYRYARRTAFIPDLLLMMVIWIGIRYLFMKIGLA